MANDLAEKISQTQNAFPSKPPGAVCGCPFANPVSAETPAPASMPVSAKTAYTLTQKMMKTLGVARHEPPKEKKAWIEIILVDAEGKPMPGVRYRITPPGGAEPIEGRLNEHGQAGLYQIEPGNCKITFPDLDRDAWE
jgi:hypothetical protein